MSSTSNSQQHVWGRTMPTVAEVVDTLYAGINGDEVGGKFDKRVFVEEQIDALLGGQTQMVIAALAHLPKEEVGWGGR
jgi:hypothetical protein